MSVHVSSWAWKQKVGDAGAKLVLLKLADQANDVGEAWPALQTLADQCEMSKSTVQRKIKHLTTLGIVTAEKRTRTVGHGQTSNLYRMVSLTTRGGQIDQGGVSTVTTQEPSVEPTSTSKDVDARLVWQAFADALGRAPTTKSERGKWNRGISELVEAGITGANAVTLIAAYRKEWPRVELTPNGLSGNLSRFAETGRTPQQTRADRLRELMQKVESRGEQAA